MFKKGLLLSVIFLLIFSVCGYATDYKYTQESGTGFFVSTADKSDSIEDTCELRQIVNDLGTLLDHSKMDGLYPKDETTGGTLQIPETALKFSNAPANDDIAAYIAGEMSWQTKSELGIQPLDTALTNISALVYVSPSFIKLTANDTYAVRTLAETKEDLSLNYVENLKVKLDATQAPTVNNDVDEGYTAGSHWVDVTNDKAYVCLDNTDGAAVWTETTGAGGGASQLSDLSDVGVTTPTDKYVLVADGDSWESRALVEADISDLGSYATLTGDEVLTNKDINLTNALGSDHTYSGEVDSQPVGESVVFGDLLYFNWTDKEWKKAKADAFATAYGTRIALESKADGETCLMLAKGYIRDDSAFDFGAVPIFLNDDTAGTCDDTAPAESGDQIFKVGEAKSADILFFDPGKDVGEI